MPTSFTRSIAIAAPPEVVFDFVADPHQLPRWAPGFARAVRPDGDHWVVDTGAGELTIRVRTSRELGTVDLLAPAAPDGVDRGAFARVVGDERACEMMFTQVFPEHVPEADVASQAAVVEEELRTVRSICEEALPSAA